MPIRSTHKQRTWVVDGEARPGSRIDCHEIVLLLLLLLCTCCSDFCWCGVEGQLGCLRYLVHALACHDDLRVCEVEFILMIAFDVISVLSI